MYELLIIIILGFIIDFILGDPVYRYHPVRITGYMISFIEKRLRAINLDGKMGGVVLVAATELIIVGCYLIISFLFNAIHSIISICFAVYVCYSCIALRDLADHIKPVINGLETNDVPGAANAVAKVVGRDVNYLDRAGVSRAAIETLAENFVDGFLSPIFWYFIGGLIGYLVGVSIVMTSVSFMLASKVGSTLDSMVGYMNQHYIRFGWAGARLDDLINFIPARLSVVILFLGSHICRLHPIDGFRGAMKDRLKHDSPNSAHAESFVAGALNVRLGGPTRYREGLKEKPWLGESYLDPGPEQIAMVIRLMLYCGWMVVLIPILLLITFNYFLVQ